MFCIFDSSTKVNSVCVCAYSWQWKINSQKSTDKLWCYMYNNASFKSELSPLFTFKISRLENYQNSYKKLFKATQIRKLLLCIPR